MWIQNIPMNDEDERENILKITYQNCWIKIEIHGRSPQLYSIEAVAKVNHEMAQFKNVLIHLKGGFHGSAHVHEKKCFICFLTAFIG